MRRNQNFTLLNSFNIYIYCIFNFVYFEVFVLSLLGKWLFLLFSIAIICKVLQNSLMFTILPRNLLGNITNAFVPCVFLYIFYLFLPMHMNNCRTEGKRQNTTLLKFYTRKLHSILVFSRIPMTDFWCVIVTTEVAWQEYNKYLYHLGHIL